MDFDQWKLSREKQETDPFFQAYSRMKDHTRIIGYFLTFLATVVGCGFILFSFFSGSF